MASAEKERIPATPIPAPTQTIASEGDLERFAALPYDERQLTEPFRGILAEAANCGIVRYDWRLLRPLVEFAMDQVRACFLEHVLTPMQPFMHGSVTNLRHAPQAVPCLTRIGMHTRYTMQCTPKFRLPCTQGLSLCTRVRAQAWATSAFGVTTSSRTRTPRSCTSMRQHPCPVERGPHGQLSQVGPCYWYKTAGSTSLTTIPDLSEPTDCRNAAALCMPLHTP